MTVKFHKKNTNFQIEHFLVGACYTPDNAYFQLLELKEEREMALDHYRVSKLKTEAKKIKAQEVLERKLPPLFDRIVAFLRGEKLFNVLPTEAERAEAEADLLEISTAEKREPLLYEGLMDELAFIESLIQKLEPLRKYKDLPIVQAHEAAQREEWCLELMNRAENMLLSEGRISAAEFKTMRMHPDFREKILPRIQLVQQLMTTDDGYKRLQEATASEKEIQKILLA